MSSGDDDFSPGPDSPEAPDTVGGFAADLRRLRLEADSPTLAKLQHATGISRSVLSDAFAGRQLPSARTVDRIVRACDAAPAAWLARRDILAGLGIAQGVSVLDGAEVAPGQSRDAGVRKTTAIWMAAGSFVLGVAASVGITLLIVPGMLGGSSGGPRITVANGEDPAATECVDDAAVATGDTRADNSLLEIVWSDKCQAGWGRITRYDGLTTGNTVSISLYPQTAPDGPDRQDVVEQDVQGAYTGLIVRPTDDTLLCAEGSFTVDGKRIDLGDPLCI